MTASVPTAWAIQKGVVVGVWRGLVERTKMSLQGVTRVSLAAVSRKPGISYYKALFTSLENYQELW